MSRNNTTLASFFEAKANTPPPLKKPGVTKAKKEAPIKKSENKAVAKVPKVTSEAKVKQPSEDDSKALVVSKGLAIVKPKASTDYINFELSRTGKKSAENLASGLYKPISKLSNADKSVLVQQFKRAPLYNPENETVATDDFEKAKLAIIEKEHVSKWEDLPLNKRVIAENGYRDRLRVGIIGTKLLNFDANLSWDHVAIALENDIKAIRELNNQLIPRLPNMFYTKCYFAGATFNEAKNEYSIRLTLALTALGELTQYNEGTDLSDLSFLDKWSFPKADEQFKILAITEAHELLKKKGDKALGIKLDAGYILDAKMLTTTKEFKLSTYGGQSRSKMVSDVTNYYFLIILACDYLLNTNYADTVEGDRNGLINNSTLGRAYYDSLRALRGLLRSVKGKVFGFTKGNPRQNRESMEEIEEEVLSTSMDYAVKEMKNIFGKGYTATTTSKYYSKSKGKQPIVSQSSLKKGTSSKLSRSVSGDLQETSKSNLDKMLSEEGEEEGEETQEEVPEVDEPEEEEEVGEEEVGDQEEEVSTETKNPLDTLE